jgi:hypothetical protein
LPGIKGENRLRVSENRALWRIFGQRRDKITGGWRKLHNEELHNLYSLPVIISLTKSRRMRWVGNVVHMKEERRGFWLENQSVRDHLVDLDIGGRIIRWVLER